MCSTSFNSQQAECLFYRQGPIRPPSTFQKECQSKSKPLNFSLPEQNSSAKNYLHANRKKKITKEKGKYLHKEHVSKQKSSWTKIA